MREQAHDNKWHALDVQEVLKYLGVSEKWAFK